MDRLRDLATRTRRVDCHFRIPKSLSTTSLVLHKPAGPDEDSDNARSTSCSTIASASLTPKTLLPGNLGTPISSLHSDPTAAPTLASPVTRPTSARPRDQEGAMNTEKRRKFSINKDEKQPRMKANEDGKESLKGDGSFPDHQTDHKLELFDQILTNIAQDDAIANSGLELHHRVNKCARDYMEAKQIVERREHEIAAISAKIKAMQATMDDASKHLHKAQAIAAEAIDSSIAEQFRLKEQDNLTNILIGMTNAIAKENCHNWPGEKVNKYLEDLQSVYHKNKHYCQSTMVSSGVVHVAKHFVSHADYDDAFEPMLFHLANQTDYKGFVERSRKEDQEFAKQHQVDYTTRPKFFPKSSTTAAHFGDEGPADKAKGSQSSVGAPYQGPDGAAGAAQGQSHGSKDAPLQNSTTLPPRSSSLPSPARKTPANAPHRLDHQRPDAPGDAVFPDPHGDTTYIYKHFDFKPSADMNDLAHKICSQLEPQPGLTSGIMNAAVLESIAGLEAIFKDGTAGVPPKLRKDVASAVENIKRLNKDRIKSEQVTRNLSAVSEAQCSRSIQTHEISDRRIRVDVTMRGSCQCFGCKTAVQDGPESTVTHDDNSTHHGDMAATGGNSDQLWKDHYISSIAPGKL